MLNVLVIKSPLDILEHIQKLLETKHTTKQVLESLNNIRVSLEKQDEFEYCAYIRDLINHLENGGPDPTDAFLMTDDDEDKDLENYLPDDL